MNEGGRLLSEVTYLGSLASQPAEVGSFLDPVRLITSRVGRSQSFSSQDISALQDVKGNLQKYLVTQEKIASFTPESLQIRLKEHFESTQKPSRRLMGVLATIVGVTILSSFVPVATSEIRATLIGSTFNAMLSLGAAYFFLTSIRAFTSSVRKAYASISIGFALVSLSQIVLPILIINTKPGTDAYQAIGIWIAIVDLLAIGFLYAGIRQYAQQTSVQSRLLDIKLPVILAVVAIAVSSLAVLLINQGSAILKVNIVLQGASTVLFITLALIMHRVADAMTVIYGKAARALLQALILSSTVAAYFYMYFFLELFYSQESLELVFMPGVMLGAVACMFNLRAGYSFYKSSKY